jgi:Leucine-rich repeat (LRR) protein
MTTSCGHGLTAAHLSLRGNRLRSLASLQPFGATLRTVDASLNEISSIEADAFFLSDGLAELNLSSNRLEISAFRSPNSMTLFGLTALRRLDLSSNNFTELSEPDMLISTRTTLTELDLSNNVIMRIADDALADLSALESLDLSRNRIQSLTSQNFLGLVWFAANRSF